MNTAVFVRGHARTWCLTKDNTLRFFEEIYGKVHWYLGFLDTGTVSQTQISDHFSGSHLMACALLDQKTYDLPESNEASIKWATYHSAYWRLAWIDYHLGKAKRAHEVSSGIRYDSVIFIRPDVWYYEPIPARDRLTKRLNTLSVSDIGSNGDIADDWSVGDLIWRAGPAAADLISLRYIDPIYTDSMPNQLMHGSSHSLLAYMPTHRHIGYDNAASAIIQSCLIRPDHADHLPFDDSKIDPNHRDSHTWSARTPAEKREYCLRLGISPMDYQL